MQPEFLLFHGYKLKEVYEAWFFVNFNTKGSCFHTKRFCTVPILTNHKRRLFKMKGYVYGKAKTWYSIIIISSYQKFRKNKKLVKIFHFLSFELLSNDLITRNRVFLPQDCLFVCDTVNSLRILVTYTKLQDIGFEYKKKPDPVGKIPLFKRIAVSGRRLYDRSNNCSIMIGVVCLD